MKFFHNAPLKILFALLKEDGMSITGIMKKSGIGYARVFMVIKIFHRFGLIKMEFKKAEQKNTMKKKGKLCWGKPWEVHLTKKGIGLAKDLKRLSDKLSVLSKK